MVDETIILFANHHIELPLTPMITPEQIRHAINTWLVKTFAREWSIIASGYSLNAFPHGAKDAFSSDPDDSDNPLNLLTRLKSPCFLPEVLCRVKYCSYLAYLHPYCAACCRQKFGVEVRQTKSEAGGLGLFATSKWEGKGDDEKMINFCTRVEHIDEQDCSPFHL